MTPSRAKHIMGIYVFFILLIAKITFISADCMLNIKQDLTTNHPLLLSMNNPKWVSLSDSPKGYVIIGRDNIIRLVCASSDPSKKNTFNQFKDTNIITAKCKSGKDFEVNKKTYSFNDLQCESPVETTELKTRQQCQGKDTELIKVGFKFGDEFVNEYEVCFDKKEKLTKYTEVTVPATIDKGVSESKEQTWKISEDLKDINLNSLYKCDTQKETFRRILNKDFFGNNRCCLEKGKLVSNNDMIFSPEQASTANYLNTVPQWSTCNKANWNEVEKRIKNLATSLNRPLTVWSGTYRNLRLPAKWGLSYKDMYLNYVDSTHKAVPVPLYLWKVVFDQHSQKGVAIIEINNPNLVLTDIETLVLCDDICHNVNWINFLERKTILNGYVFCCDLHNFEFGFAFKTSPFPKATGGVLRDDNMNRG